MTKIEGPGSTPPVPGGGLSPITEALGAIDKLGEMFEHSYTILALEGAQHWLWVPLVLLFYINYILIMGH